MQSCLWQTQLDGEHKLFNNKLILTWNGSLNGVSRINPDDRFVVTIVAGKKTDGNDALRVIGSTNRFDVSAGHLMYSNLKENKKNFGFNLEHPFEVLGNRQSIKTGYLGTFRDAKYQQQYLTPEEDEYKRIELKKLIDVSIINYFNPKNFEDGLMYYELSGLKGIADYYGGKQKIHAGYLMGELSFFKKLRLIAGVRAEKTKMNTTTIVTDMKVKNKDVTDVKDVEFELIESDTTIYLNLTNWLPSATLIYSIRPEINLRAAYSKTLARPDFRELSRSIYYNVDER